MKEVWKGFMNLFDKFEKSNSVEKSNLVSTSTDNVSNQSTPKKDVEPATNYINKPVPFERILWKNTDSAILPKIAEFGKNFTQYIKKTIDNNILSSDNNINNEDEHKYNGVNQSCSHEFPPIDTVFTGVSRKRKRIHMDRPDNPELFHPYEENMLKMLKDSPSPPNLINTPVEHHRNIGTTRRILKPIRGSANFNISNQREVYNFGKNRPTNTYGLPSSYVAVYDGAKTAENHDEIPVSFETYRRLKTRYKIDRKLPPNLAEGYDTRKVCEKCSHDARAGKTRRKKEKRCHSNFDRCCRRHRHQGYHHKSKSRRSLKLSDSCSERCEIADLDLESNKVELEAAKIKKTKIVDTSVETQPINKPSLVEYSVQAGDSMLESPQKSSSIVTPTNIESPACSGQILIDKICTQLPPIDKGEGCGINTLIDLAAETRTTNNLTTGIDVRNNLFAISSNQLDPSNKPTLVNAELNSPLLTNKNPTAINFSLSTNNKPGDFNFNLETNKSPTDFNASLETKSNPSELRLSVIDNKRTPLKIITSQPLLSSALSNPLTITNQLKNSGSSSCGLSSVFGLKPKTDDSIEPNNPITLEFDTLPTTCLLNDNLKQQQPSETVSSSESPFKSTTSELLSVSSEKTDRKLDSADESSNPFSHSKLLKATSESNSGFDQHNLFKSTDSSEVPPKAIFDFAQGPSRENTISTSTDSTNIGDSISTDTVSDSTEDKQSETLDKSSSITLGLDSQPFGVSFKSGTAGEKLEENADLNTATTQTKPQPQSVSSLENKLFGQQPLGFGSTSFATNVFSPTKCDSTSQFNTTQPTNPPVNVGFGSSNRNTSFPASGFSATSFVTANSNNNFNSSTLNSLDPNQFIKSVENSSFGTNTNFKFGATQMNGSLPSFSTDSISLKSGFGSTPAISNPFTKSTTESTGFKFDPIPTLPTSKESQPEFGFGSSANASSTPQVQPFSFQPEPANKAGMNFDFGSTKSNIFGSHDTADRPVSANSNSQGFSFTNATATSSVPKFGSSSDSGDTPDMAFMKKRALRQKRR